MLKRLCLILLIFFLFFSLHSMTHLMAPIEKVIEHSTRVPETPSVKTNQIFHGTASWYGKPFHGRLTANGERYDMYRFSAAHKTLKLGTYLEVTNLMNGKKVIVKVNDRGPYIHGRSLDLSYAAAKELGFVERGLIRYEARILKSRPEQFAQLP